MESNEPDEFQHLIEQGVVSNEQKAAELEKLGYEDNMVYRFER